jgi:CspA family cold shock protein
MTGSVVKIVDDRGFGFIKPDEGEKELFFHARSLAEGVFDELKEGDKVTFEIEEGPKGPAAVDVEKAE